MVGAEIMRRLAAASMVWAVLLASGAVLAQGNPEDRSACTGDVWRLCASEIPFVDRIVACLRRSKPNLSPACQQVFNRIDGTSRTASRSVAVDTAEAAGLCAEAPAPGQDPWTGWCQDSSKPH